MLNNTKTYFVYDSETGFILSGLYSYADKNNDGFNIFTRPYQHPHLHSKDERCQMDYLFKTSGLKSLRKENMRVGVIDGYGFGLKKVWIKNADSLSKEAPDGWWKLLDSVTTI